MTLEHAKQIKYWLSGNRTFLKNKADEDILFSKCADKYRVNCKRNPGLMAERATFDLLQQKKLENLQRYGRYLCNWSTKNTYIRPDIISEKYIFEIKSLRYYNCQGKLGNQGTAPEKIDSVFRKYAGIKDKYNKLVIIVICGALQFDPNVQIYLDAYEKQDFHNNKMVELIYNNFKDQIIFTRFQNLFKFL